MLTNPKIRRVIAPRAPEPASVPTGEPERKPRATLPQPIEVLNLDDALLNVRTVSAVTSLSASTVYRGVKAGTFPAPIKRGTRCVRWPARAVREWLASQARPEVRAA